MITSKGEIALLNISTKIQRNHSYSTALCGQCLLPDKPSIIKEIANNPTHSWEYNDFSYQPDPTGPLTKSSLILSFKMRSTLEANLAKSITTNKKKLNHKKLFCIYNYMMQLSISFD